MPGDIARQTLDRLRALEDEVKALQTRERNIDKLALRDGIAAPGSVTGIGFLFIDNADGLLKILYADGTTVTLGAASGASTFLDLTDTPSAYTGSANAFVRVGAGTASLVFGTVDWADIYNIPAAGTAQLGVAAFPTPGFAVSGGTVTVGTVYPRYSGVPTAGALAYWTGNGTVAAAGYGTADVARYSGAPTPGNYAYWTAAGTIADSGFGTAQLPRYSGAPTAGYIAYWTGNGTVAPASFGTADVVTLTGIQTLAHKTLGTPTINQPSIVVFDNAWTMQDNGDASKQMQFELSAITAGNTRTYTMPDASGTVPVRSLAQAWTALQTFSSGIAFANETLSTYDEGTWTPEITGSSSNPTVAYTTQSGSYTRIGNVIVYGFRIVINTISGGSGNIQISLPVAVGQAITAAIRLDGVDLPGTPASMIFVSVGGAQHGLIEAINDNAARTVVQISALAAGDILQAGGMYLA